MLSQFALRHPQLEVQLRLTDSPINLVEQAYDQGIGFGDLPDTRLSASRTPPTSWRGTAASCTARTTTPTASGV